MLATPWATGCRRAASFSSDRTRRPRVLALPTRHRDRARRAVGLVATTLALALLSPSLWAASTLREALELAWARSAQAQAAQAQGLEAEAAATAAQDWLPQAPSLAIARTQGLQRAGRGQLEHEIELSLPLWLPGQLRAQQALAARSRADAEAAVAAARLALAGELRAAVWRLAAADAEVQLAAEREHTARALEADVGRREAAGELARTDLLLAREETLGAGAALAEARGSAQQARERYRLLTGQAQLPATIEEALASAAATPHPQARLAQAEVEQARAALELARAQRSEAPELALGLQREREAYGAASTERVRLALRIPLGSDARNAPRVAAAQAALLRAQAVQRQREAELDAERRTARAALEQAELAAQAAQTRAELAAQRLALQHKAFTLGELALAEFMRARALANEARLQWQRARLARAAARAQVNQAQGVLP